jgi:hypothetical protein
MNPDTKVYETIQESRTFGFDEIQEALNIVRDFIMKKKLPLYGGMCIDINLKRDGHKGIYGPETIPDYDCYSPDPYGDSIELCDILLAAGYEGVKSHNAMHISTRRVLINNINVVCDLSYMPPKIYKSVPTASYEGILVVSPEFQFMDMHQAMSRVYDNPPLEVVNHRTSKDFKRFRLLRERYDLSKGVKPLAGNTSTLEFTVPAEPVLLDGFSAYAYIYKAAQLLIESVPEFQHLASSLINIIHADISVDSGKIKISGPDMHIVLGSHHYMELAQHLGLSTKVSDMGSSVVTASGKNVKKTSVKVKTKEKVESEVRYTKRYGDSIRPNAIMTPEFELFDMCGIFVGCYDSSNNIKNINSKFPILPDNVKVANIHRVLTYFIQRYNSYLSTEAEKKVALAYYVSTLQLWDLGAIFIDLKPKIVETSDLETKDWLPFFVSATIFGDRNISSDYIAFIYDRVAGMGTETANLRMPGPYYPDRKNLMSFDYTKSIMLDFDGDIVDTPRKHIDMFGY